MAIAEPPDGPASTWVESGGGVRQASRLGKVEPAPDAPTAVGKALPPGQVHIDVQRQAPAAAIQAPASPYAIPQAELTSGPHLRAVVLLAVVVLWYVAWYWAPQICA